MQNVPASPTTPSIIGWIIALLVLAATLVLWLIGQLEPRLALLIGGLALARLI